MADHTRFMLATDIQVYCYDPTIPGSEGPTNIPMACYGNTSRKAWMCRRSPNPSSMLGPGGLNERPRTTLNVETPAERFKQSVAATA